MSTAKEPKTAEKKTGTDIGRYTTVTLAQQWLTVLLRSEDCKGMGPSELVKKALDDIKTGAVSPEEVNKAAAKVQSMPVPAEEAKEKKE